MSGMPRAALPHLQREKTRHGKLVWYFRVEKGPRLRLPGLYGSSEFLAAYHAALNGRGPQTRAPAAQGTFLWASALYRKSQDWSKLSLATRRQRECVLRGVEALVGGQPLSAFRRSDIIAARDRRADKPGSAKHYVQTMKGFFAWALDAGYVRVDPAAGVQVARPRSEGYAVWTEDDLAAFRARWPLGTRERVALEVLFGTGLRRGDATRVGRPHLRDGVIRMTTEKTGERVAIAVSDDLTAALAAGPVGDLTFIAGVAGRPRDKAAFGEWFREACKAAGIAGKSAHGIRKAAATADAEAGWSDAELDAKYGWTGRREAARYTRSASRERLSLGAAERTKERTFRPEPYIPKPEPDKKVI